MLGKCQNRLNGPFNIFENKGKPNESLNRFNLDSTRFQQAFNIFTFSTMLDDLFKRTEHLVQQSVECKLKQMLKPFKRAFTDAEESYKYLMINFFKLLEIFASHSKWTKKEPWWSEHSVFYIDLYKVVTSKRVLSYTLCQSDFPVGCRWENVFI